MLALAAAPACSEEAPPEDCPARAAFHIVVRADDGPLPRQTKIHVDHGGGSEEFLLDTPMKREVVLCEPTYADAGGGDAGEQEVLSVSCELWTQGATLIQVQAPPYPTLERELAVELEEGCIHTQSVELLLTAGDGSTAPSE